MRVYILISPDDDGQLEVRVFDNIYKFERAFQSELEYVRTEEDNFDVAFWLAAEKELMSTGSFYEEGGDKRFHFVSKEVE